MIDVRVVAVIGDSHPPVPRFVERGQDVEYGCVDRESDQ